MSKMKSSQVHCISSHDHILMMASTSKHIPEIRLYKAWKEIFLWWGLIFGPDVNSLFLASFLIGAPALTFCIRMLVWIQKDDPIFNYTVLTSAFILTLLKRGLLKNVKEVLFAKIPPSQLDLRAMVPEEDDGSEYESEYSSSIRYNSEMGGKVTKRESLEKLSLPTRNLGDIDTSNEYETAKDGASSELDPSFYSSQLDLPNDDDDLGQNKVFTDSTINPEEQPDSTSSLNRQSLRQVNPHKA
ncbi:BnaCnng71350D [Brassica napus]|nr:BnaCnng71350D [Brassica napus]